MRLIRWGSNALCVLFMLASAAVTAQTNLALTATASGSSNLQPANLASDGNTSTRWESAHGVDPSWLTIDLGTAKNLSSVQVVWEAANAANYLILGSNNNLDWATLKIFTGGAFGNRTDTHTVAGTYRYVRMHATQRSAGNNWGYSIFEFRVFGAVPISSSSAATSSVPAGSCDSGCVTTLNANTLRATVTKGDTVDIHYRINGGAQQNLRMSLAGGIWTYDISNLKASDLVSVYYTIITAGAGQDTPARNYSLTSGPSSTPSSSVGSSISNGIVRLYQHCNYGGWVANFNTGNFSTANIVSAGGIDNDASSLRIAPGYQATLYPNSNFGGTPLILTGDVGCLVGNNFNDVLSSMVVSPISNSSSSSVSVSSSSSSATSLGNVVPLYNSATTLEPAIKVQSGNRLITRIADRARDRHAKESHFQSYEHFLSFYWEHRTASIEIIETQFADDTASIRMNVRTQFRLNDTEAENRWFYRGVGTVAEYCDNGTMVVVDNLNYYKERTFNCRTNQPIRKGDKLEFELSQFLDHGVPNGRAAYYGTTYLYVVGEGIVPWTVGGSTPAGGIKDSVKIPEGAWLGGGTTLHADASNEPDNAYIQMATNTGYNNAQPFVLGRRVLHTSFLNGTHDERPVENPVFSELVGKAGPRYVHESCASCHVRNGRAAPNPVGQALDKWVFRVADANSNPHPNLGRVLQPIAIGGAASEGTPSIASWSESNGLRTPNYQFTGPTPDRFSARIAPPMIGIGLLEAIPESAILAKENINGSGISGKANRVIDPVTGQTRLGRFGWKAGTGSVKHQVASALNTDMGVMNSAISTPDCGSAQTDCGAGGSELSDTHLNNLVKYVSLLGVRPQRNFNDAAVQNGKTLFTNIGCAGCHTPSHQTSEFHPLAELRNQTIYPYSDLLLHDMGPGLADNLGEGLASGSEWRTTPLWGLGASACVTGGMTEAGQGAQVCTPVHSYLHDGRARSIQEAILWHGGEGEAAKNAYNALGSNQKSDVLRFLESL